MQYYNICHKGLQHNFHRSHTDGWVKKKKKVKVAHSPLKLGWGQRCWNLAFLGANLFVTVRFISSSSRCFTCSIFYGVAFHSRLLGRLWKMNSLGHKGIKPTPFPLPRCVKKGHSKSKFYGSSYKVLFIITIVYRTAKLGWKRGNFWSMLSFLSGPIDTHGVAFDDFNTCCDDNFLELNVTPKGLSLISLGIVYQVP